MAAIASIGLYRITEALAWDPVDLFRGSCDQLDTTVYWAGLAGPTWRGAHLVDEMPLDWRRPEAGVRD